MHKDTNIPLVQAAGGVVSANFPEGVRVLMMLRRGMWDLPKGHVEEGETFRECAAREVCEECGLEASALVVGDELVCTRHSYLTAEGCTETKQVVWFSMKYNGDPASLKPQTEEDISALEWVSLAEARCRAATSFETIRDVIEKLITQTI